MALEIKDAPKGDYEDLSKEQIIAQLEKANKELQKKAELGALKEADAQNKLNELANTVTQLQTQFQEARLKEKSEESDGQKIFFKELVDELKTAGNNAFVSMRQRYTKPNFAKEDLLDQEVVFVCPKVFHVIVDKIVEGRPVQVPFGPIMFDRPTYRIMRGADGGKGDVVQYQTTYHCRSKKELEFLESHADFEVHFFRMDKSNMINDIKVLNFIKEQMNSLQNRGAHEIMMIAKDLGLKIEDCSVDQIAKKIAMKRTADEMAKTEDYREIKRKVAAMEALLLGG